MLEFLYKKQIENSRSAKAANARAQQQFNCLGCNMPLFPEENDKCQTSQLYYLQAKQLRNITVKKLHFSQRWTSKKWSKEFQLLCQEQDNNYPLVQTILDWYEENCTRLPKPRIQHAKQFRKCFTWLKDLYDKDATKPVVLSKKMKMLHNLTLNLTWPKGSKSKLPLFIHHSYKNYKLWRKRLLKLSKKKHEVVVQMSINHLANVLPPADRFIDQWIRSVNNEIINWDAWNGDLMYFVFTPQQKLFLNQIRAILSGYLESEAATVAVFDVLGRLDGKDA